MEVSIQRVDGAGLSDADLRAVYELAREISLESHPEDGFLDEASFAAGIRTQPANLRSTRLIARQAGAVLGCATVGWREGAENRHLAHVGVEVAAAARRRGIGRRLLAESAEVAQADGRSLLMSSTTGRLPFAEAFCRAVGAELGMVEHENRLELEAVDRQLVQSWLVPRPGYSLLTVDGAIPPELQAEAAKVLEVMNDAPRGDLREEDVHETPEEISAFEAMIVACGHEIWSVFARHETTGRLAGFTRTSWHPSMPAVVSQWGTAVDRDHRGHGLGRWMKGTMLDRVLRERPQARRVATTNATTNRWMLAINHELGFRAVSTWTHWQIETAKVRYTSAQSARPLE